MAVGLDHYDGLAMRGVTEFNVAGSIPAGATITSVTLTVWVDLTFSNSTPSVELHKLTSNWGEGASSPPGFMPPFGTAQTGDATWDHTFYLNQYWKTPGGDFSSVVSGVKTIGLDNQSYTWSSTPQMVADVQGWLNNPSTNYGWLLKGDESQESGKLIATRESTVAAHRPSLTITYTVGASTPDLAISASHSGSFHAGDSADIYTILVANVGAGATNGLVTVTDTLPAGLTPTAASGSGWTTSISGSTVTATRSDPVSGGGSYPALTLTASVGSSAPTSVTNSVSVSGGGETNTANDTATDPTTIVQLADLAIAMSHTGDFHQGDSADNYTINVSNIGGGVSSGQVTVTDTLPTGLTPTAASGSGWTTGIVGSKVTATRNDSLVGGGSFPALTITVSVANNAPTSLTSSATVAGGGELNTANDTANDPTTISQIPDLAIALSHAGNFKQGDNADGYTIIVTNAGPGPTNGQVTITDTLPAGLTPTAASGNGWTANIAGSTVTATRSDTFASGGNYPALAITVKVAGNAPASVTNSARVAGGGETNTANDTATDPTTISSAPDLTISATHSGSFRQLDTADSYTLTVSNIGSIATSGQVTVIDTLPAGLTPTTASGTGWSTSVTGSTVTASRSDSLTNGGSYPPLTLSLSVTGSAPPSVTNTASVAGGGETNATNDTASDPTTIGQLSDLAIGLRHVGNFHQGDSADNYTITVSNTGAGSTSGLVTVTDTLPAGLTPTAASGTGWATSIVGSMVTATRSDNISGGGSYPALIVTVSVAGSASGSVTNSATVTGGGEINTTNDTANDPTFISDSSANYPPSFTKGSDQQATDESGPQSIPGWATNISAGPPSEAGQTLTFSVTNDASNLFSSPPAIDSAGKLTFTPKPNMSGTAHVTVVLKDNGGTANGGVDTSPSQTFSITITKPDPLHNAVNALDVDADGYVVALDALLVINYINLKGAGPIAPNTPVGPPYYDTNEDGFVTANDVLLIVNQLNAPHAQGEALNSSVAVSPSVATAAAINLDASASGTATEPPAPTPSGVGSSQSSASVATLITSPATNSQVATADPAVSNADSQAIDSLMADSLDWLKI
jgi:uncharacterized repeat protein (TIGR01451 family)